MYYGFPNNTASPSLFPSPIGSYQPRWDSALRLAQQLIGYTPMIPNAGNHELEPLLHGNYFTVSSYRLQSSCQQQDDCMRFPPEIGHCIHVCRRLYGSRACIIPDHVLKICEALLTRVVAQHLQLSSVAGS